MNLKLKRQVELDLLRIVALLAVILVHTCGMKTHELPVTDKNWQILTFLAAIVTWQVPIYVMISGRFFLDPEKEVTLLTIWKKYIWRLVLVFCIWGFVYQMYYILFGNQTLNWKGVLSQYLIGPYHFWYLHMMIWLYAITPFLRLIAKDKKLCEYFIVLFLLFEFWVNYGVELPLVGSTVSTVLDKTNFSFALGYAGYYILGYYLYKWGIPKKLEIPLYILGILLAIFSGIATTCRAVKEGVNYDWYSKYLLPNVVIEASALYVFFIKHVSKYKFSARAVRRICELSEQSFGVYIIHALVIEFIAMAGINPIIASPFIVVPFIMIMAFIISNIIVYGIRKIPYVGKRIT